MQNFNHDAKSLNFTAGADLSGGDLISVGGHVGVVVSDVKSGGAGAAEISGSMKDVKKTTGESWAVGDSLYLNTTTSALTKTGGSGNVYAGKAAAVAQSADATGEVILNSGLPQAAHIAAIATVDGSDAGTTQTLANATKAKLNAVILALESVGIFAAS